MHCCYSCLLWPYIFKPKSYSKPSPAAISPSKIFFFASTSGVSWFIDTNVFQLCLIKKVWHISFPHLPVPYISGTKLPVTNISGNDRPLLPNIQKKTGRWGIYHNVFKWVFPKIVVPPKSSHFNRVFHPFWGSPIFGNTHISLGQPRRFYRDPSLVIQVDSPPGYVAKVPQPKLGFARYDPLLGQLRNRLPQMVKWWFYMGVESKIGKFYPPKWMVF